MRIPYSVSAIILLSGCSLFQTQPSAVVSCPATKQYTPQFMDQLALQFPTLPPESRQFETDYIAERDRLRACRG